MVATFSTVSTSGWRAFRSSPADSCSTRVWTMALQGAVVKDEEKDKISWKEYLENVMKKRGSQWLPLYRACRELNEK